MRVTEARLELYAKGIVADGEASSSELRTVLAAANASNQRACAEPEIVYFRALIFESEFIKDVGRMNDGQVLCSAAIGKPAKPLGTSPPDFTQQDGTNVYTHLDPYKDGDLTILTLQLGNFFVAFTPYTRIHLEAAPMHYFETVTDSPSQKTGLLLGDLHQNVLPILTSEDQGRRGDVLYATRCSIRFFNCVTTYATIPDLIQANRAKYYICVAVSGLTGTLFGILCSLLYRHNKSMEQQLRRAIRQDKLQIVYQPIVELASGRIVGAEALVRWTDEEGFAVGPDVFVRIAEQRGFVHQITRLVLRHVLRDFAKTLRNFPDFHLSINVAASDLSDATFLPLLEDSLHHAAVAPQSLTIEITEGSTAKHEIAIETIHSLRRRGHSVHIDDFGTGYSSLSYLHQLSVDAIKIDRSFTQAIGTESVIVAILPQILALAKALDLSVVVEGIETQQQAVYFLAADQHVFAQGWLFGRPIPASEFIQKMQKAEKERLEAIEVS